MADALGCLFGVLLGLGLLVFAFGLIFRFLAASSVRSAREAPARVPSSTPPAPTEMDGVGYLEVVGESHYQDALRLIADKHGRICSARLVPEPDNAFDHNAVMVEIDGHTVGYLSRAEARRYQRRLLPLASPIQVPAKLIGGTRGKPSFGVLLDHREVEALSTPKRTRKRKPEIPPDDQPF
jgi:hypothetical protein